MPKVPITASPHAFYIRPAPGWLDVVFEEVTAVAQSPLQKYKFEPKITLLKSTVKLHRCDWRQGLEVLLRLTSAHDLEWLVLESKCTQWTEVDAILERVPWDEILPNRENPVHVTADVSEGFTTNSAKLRENLCKIAGVKHVSEGGVFRFKIELRGELLRILVSLAGDPLYKRGYKAKMAATAPLPEHQAAACTHWVLSGMKEKAPIASVFVPFAGSGTLGFEAALVLSGAGPGAFSRQFTCDLFPCTPAATMGFLRRKILERLKNGSTPILFNDFNSEAIGILRENTLAFSSDFYPQRNFEIVEGDVFELNPTFPSQGKVLTLLNPPYGNRLAQETDVSALYRRLGNHMQNLGRALAGRLLGGCICPDEFSWKGFLGELRNPDPETHHFTHGGKEMRLVRWKT